jgi:hypothetical protein
MVRSTVKESQEGGLEMKRWLMALSVACAAGCSGQSVSSEGGWVQTDAALQAHGIYSLRAGTESDAQVVWLRGGLEQSVGRLDIAQSGARSTIALTVYEHSFGQTIAVDQSQMVVSLDGREGTLRFDGGTWQGDADAKTLLADAQSYVALVQLIGVAAQISVMAPATGAASAAPMQPPAPQASPATTPAPANGGSGTPAYVCGDVVTTSSGWAWYWEPNSQAEACKRANDLLDASCKASTGAACCNTPAKNGCVSCFNWGTGWACATSGYLQYLSE